MASFWQEASFKRAPLSAGMSFATSARYSPFIATTFISSKTFRWRSDVGIMYAHVPMSFNSFTVSNPTPTPPATSTVALSGSSARRSLLLRCLWTQRCSPWSQPSMRDQVYGTSGRVTRFAYLILRRSDGETLDSVVIVVHICTVESARSFCP